MSDGYTITRRRSAAATVKITPGTALSDSQREQLSRLPGVCPYERAVWAPPSIADKVAAYIRTRTGSATERWPDPPVPRPGELAVADYIPREARPTVKWYGFQDEGLRFTAIRTGAQLWWACGAGKAPVGIVGAHQAPGPILIVTKVDTRPHYRTQVRKFTTTEPYVFGPDSPDVKREPVERYLERQAADGRRALVVTGYENLQRHLERFLAMPRFQSVVFDEVHKAQERKRTRSTMGADGRKLNKALNNISYACKQMSVRADRRIATSRTPAPDRRRALYAVVDLTHPGEWGDYYTPFAMRYCDGSLNPEHGGIFDKGKSNTEEFKARLSWLVHIVPQHVLAAELPPLTRTVRYIPAECQDASASVAVELREAKRTRQKSRIVHVRLLQIASRKRSTVVDICEEAFFSGKKVLVLTGRRREVIALRDACCERLGFDPEQVNGGLDTSVPIWTSHDDTGGEGTADLQGPEERDRRRQAYMDLPDVDTGQRVRGEGQPAFFFGTLESTGESKDFQDTDIIVFALLSHRPKDFIQGEGRGGRIGQTRPLQVIYLVCEGTPEEAIAANLIEKMADISDIMGDQYLAQMAEDLSAEDDQILENSLIEAVLGHKKNTAHAPEFDPNSTSSVPADAEYEEIDF